MWFVGKSVCGLLANASVACWQVCVVCWQTCMGLVGKSVCGLVSVDCPLEGAID